MSKHTNSLLLRYGINIFWSASISNPSLEYRNLFFSNVFNFLLRNFNIHVFKIQYSVDLITVYVFPYKSHFNYIKQYIFYFEKRLLTKLNTRCFYGFKGIGINKQQTNNFEKIFDKKVNNSVYFLVVKVLAIKTFFSILLSSKINLSESSYLFFFFIKKNLKFAFLKKRTFFLLKSFKLYLINSLLKFKYLELISKILLNLYTNSRVSISIKSILEKPITFYRIPFFFKYLKIKILKQKLYIIILSFLFLKGSIILSYINDIVKKTKNKKHVKNLIMFFTYIKTLYKMQYIPIYGFKFRIAGRLGGKLRKSSFFYKLGYSKLLSFNMFFDYAFDVVYTIYGTFSLKLWLSNLNEYSKVYLN